MIQTQTLALDDKTKADLLNLSFLIATYKDDPMKVRELIAKHDEIVKAAQMKLYDPRADA